MSDHQRSHWGVLPPDQPTSAGGDGAVGGGRPVGGERSADGRVPPSYRVARTALIGLAVAGPLGAIGVAWWLGGLAWLMAVSRSAIG